MFVSTRGQHITAAYANDDLITAMYIRAFPSAVCFTDIELSSARSHVVERTTII